MEVEVREEASSGSSSSGRTAPATTPLVNNTPVYPVADGPEVIIRVEEVLIVGIVLVIWVASIFLFINRWGKIRMLEPYQPKFHQQPHRESCPLAPLSPPGISTQVSSNTFPRTQKPTVQRMSFSKYNVNALTDPLSVLPSPIIRRPRQNSVFVGSSTMAVLNPPRRAKSAMDIQNLVVNEQSPTASFTGSVIPILNRERRPSLLTIERPIFISRHRPSITVDRPLISQCKSRRLSCFADRSTGRHKNFISFEHHERRTPLINERASSYQPTISFEIPLESSSETSISIEDLEPLRVLHKPIASRSFEQPAVVRPKPDRMATSLDVSTSLSFDRRLSIPEEDRSSPVSLNLDDIKLTAPLLESLKSSDV